MADSSNPIAPPTSEPTNTIDQELDPEIDMVIDTAPPDPENPELDAPLPETREPTRKDISLRDFLGKMDDYAPIVRSLHPSSISHHKPPLPPHPEPTPH